MITNTYMDDVFGALKSDKEVEKRKSEMGKEWEIKDVEENKYFLSMHVQQDLDAGMICLTQRPYWEHCHQPFRSDTYSSLKYPPSSQFCSGNQHVSQNGFGETRND